MNRKDEILKHAGDLIQTKGYKGFSYADLSKRLGITKASIHHHYPSKEELGLAYCAHKKDRLTQLRAELGTKKSAKEKLSAYMGKLSSCKDGKMCGISAMQSDVADMAPELSRAVRQLTEDDINIVAEMLAEGKAQKEFNFDISAHEQAMIITTALKGALMIGRVKEDDSFEKICNALMKAIEYKS